MPKRRAARWIAPALAGLAFAALAAQGASSQGRNGDARPPERTPPERPQSPSGEGRSGSPGTLSDELSRSRGVIPAPQGVDPEMQQPAPPTGPRSTPVVPPPGAPGGDPNVRPK